MATAKRIIYNGNQNTGVDYKPAGGQNGKHAVVSGVEIPIWVDNGAEKQPVMTSNSAPSPHTASASSRYSTSYDYYECWDGYHGDATNAWASASAQSAPGWTACYIEAALKDIQVIIYNRTRSSLVNGPVTGKLYGSDNGSSWAQIGTFSRSGSASGAGTTHVCTTNYTSYNNTYKWIKVQIDTWYGGSYIAIGEIMVKGAIAT